MPEKLLIFVVAYNAETTISQVLNRIPKQLFDRSDLSTEILIIDDCSKDDTFQSSHYAAAEHQNLPLTILKNPQNLGYGGNQKLGYRYAIKNGFDYVALIHGDGQYAPEELPRLIEPLMNREADAVFGSRMIDQGGALKGGMPLYKYIGNKILSFSQNKIVGTKLSEYHSGYRLYSTAALKKVPFYKNSDGFDFDTDIIIQLHEAGKIIKELPIPTFYGDEICYVNGLQYAAKIMLTSVQYRFQRLSLFYQAKFDLETANNHYKSKYHFLSSHSLAQDSLEPGDKVLTLGCGPAELVGPLMRDVSSLTAVDIEADSMLRSIGAEVIKADLNDFEFEFSDHSKKFDKVLALDIIEHLVSPEDFLARIRKSRACYGSEVVITTPNVAFLPVRGMLMLGAFNYGKRGILDRTHTRLFTKASLGRLLQQSGFDVLELKGIPAPIPLALGNNAFARFLLNLNSIAVKIFPGLFSYQLFVRCSPRPTVERLLENSISNSNKLLEDLEKKLVGD